MDRKPHKCIHLILKRQWFEMIEKGEKTEEYRDITDFYYGRLIAPENIAQVKALAWAVERDPGMLGAEVDITHLVNGFDLISFHRGYSGVVIYYYVKKVTIGYGRPEWGAPTDRPVFKIYLDGRKFV